VTTAGDQMLMAIATECPISAELLKAEVERQLPGFGKAIEKAQTEGATLALHQDAFACTYSIAECTLLGMLIKYAGLSGVKVLIIGKNEETLEPEESSGKGDQKARG
jgi:hypothetical protein